MCGTVLQSLYLEYEFLIGWDTGHRCEDFQAGTNSLETK
jgi:hypothetical protein